jgi:biotin-dependent carboxylase-like uncharacterized protein
MSLIVLESGLASRIVDAGRPRSRSLGVSVGGAADRRSLALGNSILGNPGDAAALEIALKGPRLRAEADVGCVLFGAPFEAQRDGYPIEAGRTFTLRAGEVLGIGGTPLGARAYLCVRGGFHGRTILGSRSAFEPIEQGEILACGLSTIPPRFCPELQMPVADVCTVSVLPGLQAPWFKDEEFYEQVFTVTAASNRMGLRLQGNPLALPEREMVSEAVCPGSVQVTREGQCIVLGVDGQTIGGYPKIAQVIQADLDSLGQLRPGQRIGFKKVALEDAIKRDRQARADLRLWTLRLRLSLDAFSAKSVASVVRGP